MTPPGRTNWAAQWKGTKAQRLHTLEYRERRALAGRRPADRARLDLKVREQVMDQHDQLLPGAVGDVGYRRHRCGTPAPSSAAHGLLVIAAPTRKPHDFAGIFVILGRSLVAPGYLPGF